MPEEKAYRRNQWIEVTVLDRGRLRRELAKSEIEYKETKGLLVSLFRLKVTPTHWREIVKDFQQQGLV